MTPARRAVAVLSELRGSGAALNARLVLTCAHVVGADLAPKVAHPDHGGLIPSEVIWRDDERDAALLHTSADLPSTAHVRVGRLATDRALPDCEIVGFPDIQRHGTAGHLAADQFTGTVLPAAARPRTLLTFAFDRAPAVEPADGTSPLAGLSGAPVFAGDVLLGIVTEIPRGRGHLRAEGSLISDLSELPSIPYDLPEPEPISDHHPLDREYEREYALAVASAYRKMKIFGLDDLSRRESEWDLDTAYLSLEAAPRTSEADARNLDTVTTRRPSFSGRSAQRIDALLADRPRVLVRGDAGAGKTTLVWWLAAHVADGTLGPRLAELNGLVPFIVPLRTLRAQAEAFPGPAQLPSVARLMVDDPPHGWVGRVLMAGRGLLLVDGLDEVPQADREDAHRWLAALLTRYPRTRCVATVRPLAVEPDWLGAENFQELRLLPMRDEDIQEFIASWHRAARLDDDPELVSELEAELSQQFRHNSTLRDLARTPLLCAVICALHRRLQGFLPETRFKLYQSALGMLLGNRDMRRRVDAPDGITMTVEEHHQILQRIAVWLVRGGQSEFTHAQALPQVKMALVGMERVRVQGMPEAVLTHLLNRSGLLQEHGNDTYQFIHRTFQDFLAAKELVESGSLAELVRNAEDELWQDVILLASGHCRREIGELLDDLLEKAETPPASDRLRVQLYVLAALCSEHAAWLEADLRDRIRDRISGLVAMITATEVPQLARLGPYVLSFLPDPEKLDPAQQSAIADLVGKVGGPQAVPYARRLIDTSGVSLSALSRLVGAWANFPAAPYLRDVISRMPARVPIHVSTREQLGLVHELPGSRALVLSGPFTSSELDETRLPKTHLLHLLRLPDLCDLDFLWKAGRDLTTLNISSSLPALTDISAVAGLPAVEQLSLSLRTELPPGTFDWIPELSTLRSLTLATPSVTTVAALPVHSAVTRLALPDLRLIDTRGLEAWESLTSISVHSPLRPMLFWNFVRDSTSIDTVETSMFSVVGTTGLPPIPNVTTLSLRELTDMDSVEGILETFPALTHLRLRSRVVTAQTGLGRSSLARLRATHPQIRFSMS
ncbi:NACHT domain-containing protein [Streptomyces sp. KL116D]|uniref:NACHT domain-containing protein n=1 Tax=Streptomyces sp. KL116D TaxID=3045152 RepID=UPI003557AD4F